MARKEKKISGTILLGTVLGDVYFDATLIERTSDSSEITKNPVENGVKISDHIFRNPKKFTATVGVTDSPLRMLRSDAFANPLFADVSRSASAWEVLQKIKNAGQTFSIQNELELLDNMAIKSLSTTKSSETDKVLIADVEFEELLIVSTETERVPVSDDVKNKASEPVNTGRQQQKTEKDQTDDQRSLAKKILDALF